MLVLSNRKFSKYLIYKEGKAINNISIQCYMHHDLSMCMKIGLFVEVRYDKFDPYIPLSTY